MAICSCIVVKGRNTHTVPYEEYIMTQNITFALAKLQTD